MSKDSDYALSLVRHLGSILDALEGFEGLDAEAHVLFLERFHELEAQWSSSDWRLDGQDLLSQIFHRYPQIGHLVPRDLLWLCGGDCLHLLSDEEINRYQQLEDLRHSAEAEGREFNWVQARSQLFSPSSSGPH